MENKKATKKVAKKAAVRSSTHKSTPKKAVKKTQTSAKEPPAPKQDVKKESAGSRKSREVRKEQFMQPETGGENQQPSPVPEYKPAQPDFHPTGAGAEQNVWQDQYNDNRIVLMIRDPFWCFVYWDLSADKQAHIIREIQQAGARLILRVYDVTEVEFDGANAHRSMDIEITTEATNWYINVWASDRAYCVDLGLLYPDGRFITLVRSNIVTTPRDSVSPIVDEEWMMVDETFERLYQTAGAADWGRSSEAMVKYMLKRVRADVTSGGLASMGSEGGRPKPMQPEDFWLVVNTELIVYGATEPDATVTIQGQPMQLNPDGTFSVRYALPDGKQVIPVKAVNAEGTQERQITPVVEKHTE
ncbi:DUF4912 domain-containing protein [candidate division FCPU426 bacterium]|nr:DUF4912 domain-containing protein [candidate division FCPU426 bacterium]